MISKTIASAAMFVGISLLAAPLVHAHPIPPTCQALSPFLITGGTPTTTFGQLEVGNSPTEIAIVFELNQGLFVADVSIDVDGTTYNSAVFSNGYNDTGLPRNYATALLTPAAFNPFFNITVDTTVVELDFVSNVVSSQLIQTSFVLVDGCPAMKTTSADVRPGSSPSVVNLGSSGNTYVGVYGGPGVDLRAGIDGEFVLLNGSPIEVATDPDGTPRVQVRDLNGDGIDDVQIEFATASMTAISPALADFTVFTDGPVRVEAAHNTANDPIVVKNK